MAVKVQRPSLAPIITTDIAALNTQVAVGEKLLPRLRAFDLHRVVSEYDSSLKREIDFNREARSVMLFRTALADFHDLWIPDVVMSCCGDVPTLETLAAVSIMREHLSTLKIRIVNVIDLMKLQPQSEHPHGLSDMDFDALFTKDKLVIFAFHGYPWLIHRLTYRRTNHQNIHVCGYKEEGAITTPIDMTVLNDLDRFHLVIDCLPQNLDKTTIDKGIVLKHQLKDKLVEHKQYINKNGQDMPEIRNWKWSDAK